MVTHGKETYPFRFLRPPLMEPSSHFFRSLTVNSSTPIGSPFLFRVWGLGFRVNPVTLNPKPFLFSVPFRVFPLLGGRKKP